MGETPDDLVDRYAGLIRSAIVRVAGPRAADIGEDVVQRVRTALWKRRQREQGIDHPASYLYRCAIREALRELDRLDDPDTTVAVDEHLVDPGLDPETWTRARELGAEVEKCLDSLPADRAHAVRAHLAGFAVDEIMELYRWPYQKARNLIARGLADRRARLGAQGYS